MGLDLQAASNIKQTSGEFHRFHRRTRSFYLLLLESWNRRFHTEQERITDGTRVKMFGLFGHCKMMHDSSQWSHDASLKKLLNRWIGPFWTPGPPPRSELASLFALPDCSVLIGLQRNSSRQVGSSKIWRPIWICLKLWRTKIHWWSLVYHDLPFQNWKWGKPWNAPFWNITNPFVWHILILNFRRRYCSERLCTKAIPCCAEEHWGHLQRPANSWPC